MNNVIVLPCNPRTLNCVRRAIGERAAYLKAPEPKRLHAFGVAMRLMAEGASSAWATQAGVQDLRGVPLSSRFGGEAA